MSQPLLTMTLIAKDEAKNVDRCFSSWWDSVDEVVLCDTGSEDATIAKAKAFARKRKQPGKLKVTSVEWADDFAAARQAADDLATGQFLTWCDLDDEVKGLDQLRQLATNATEDTVAFFARYRYAVDPSGNAISELWRERVVPNTGIPWTGRLHEHKLFTAGGMIVKVDPQIAEWIHHRDHTQRTGERNLRILEKWNAEDPENSHVLHALALEYMGTERAKDASDTYARFLEVDTDGQPDRRVQATRHMCQMLMIQNRVDEARAAAFGALQESWPWADTHLSLAEVEQTLGHPDVAYMHAQNALSIGKPETLLIVNPLQYTAHPRALMALCLAQMGRFEEAVQMAQECLEIAPTYALAGQNLPLWRGLLKKQHTLGTVLALCDVLVEVGELVKARELLRLAPFYVDSDPRLVARRADVEHLISDRMGSPEVALEDEAADAFVARHLELAA